MKYLKKFKYTESLLSTKEDFKSFSEAEVEKWSKTKKEENISNSEGEAISSIFKGLNLQESFPMEEFLSEIKKSDMKIQIIGKNNCAIDITISKYDDDYFVIRLWMQYRKNWESGNFICDQISGIESFSNYLKMRSDRIFGIRKVNESYKGSTNNLITKIQKNLSPDLLKGIWKNESPENYKGYCYVATEAMYWLLGGPDSQYTPYVIGHKEWPEVFKQGETHWFLKHKKTGKIIDPTKEQFGNLTIPYDKAKANGMMNYPVGGSKRAKILISRLGR